MSTIPTLAEQNIRTFVGEQNFQKGQQLAHDGAILLSTLKQELASVGL